MLEARDKGRCAGGHNRSVMDEQLSRIQDVGAGVPPCWGRTDCDSTKIFIEREPRPWNPARAGRSRLHYSPAAVLSRRQMGSGQQQQSGKKSPEHQAR